MKMDRRNLGEYPHSAPMYPFAFQGLVCSDFRTSGPSRLGPYAVLAHRYDTSAIEAMIANV